MSLYCFEFSSHLGELCGVASGDLGNTELKELLLQFSELARQVGLALALELVCFNLHVFHHQQVWSIHPSISFMLCLDLPAGPGRAIAPSPIPPLRHTWQLGASFEMQLTSPPAIAIDFLMWMDGSVLVTPSNPSQGKIRTISWELWKRKARMTDRKRQTRRAAQK